MNRLIPIIVLSPLLFFGPALAQSVEPPSLSGLGESITGAVSDALSNIASNVPGGPGFLDPETGDDDALDPETGNPGAGDPDSLNPSNDTERRRPLDIVVIAGDPPDEVQGVVLLCKGLKAGGNPMDGLNLGSTKPKTRKQMKAEVRCKVVSP